MCLILALFKSDAALSSVCQPPDLRRVIRFRITGVLTGGQAVIVSYLVFGLFVVNGPLPRVNSHPIVESRTGQRCHHSLSTKQGVYVLLATGYVLTATAGTCSQSLCSGVLTTDTVHMLTTGHVVRAHSHCSVRFGSVIFNRVLTLPATEKINHLLICMGR